MAQAAPAPAPALALGAEPPRARRDGHRKGEEVEREPRKITIHRIEMTRFEPPDVGVEVASVEREHTEHELATARQNLAAAWGGETPRFTRAEGDLERLPVVPSDADLARSFAASPRRSTAPVARTSRSF